MIFYGTIHKGKFIPLKTEEFVMYLQKQPNGREVMVEIKDMAKFKFLKYSIANEEGVFVGEAVKHTSKLSTHELNIFIEQIKEWAAEFDIYLPDPNEQLTIENFK